MGLLTEITAQKDRMVDLVESWSKINSGSDNLMGLQHILKALRTSFSALSGEEEEIPLPPRIFFDSKGNSYEMAQGKALRIRKRSKAPLQIFLGGHMDTVFPVTSPFHAVDKIDRNIMRGPGVADMKGGLAIMLIALETLEKSPLSKNVGWEIVINPDEEIGSKSSEHLFREGAKRNHLGLIFEPAFPDGSFVSERKGSMNFTLIVHGKAAHVGRDPHNGRNAIHALAQFILHLEALADTDKGIIINVGRIEGGGPVNIVPDLAICRFNIRMSNLEDEKILRKKVANLLNECRQRDGISIYLHEDVSRVSKPFDEKTQALFEEFRFCADELAIPFKYRPSGGVCDGNILASEGLPTIDTLGAVGGNLHTSEEYLLIDSLTERARLTALFLLQKANVA